MSNYTGMKEILTKFWEKEQEKNNTKYVSKAEIDEKILTKAKDGYLLKGFNKHLSPDESYTIPEGFDSVRIGIDEITNPMGGTYGTYYTIDTTQDITHSSYSYVAATRELTNLSGRNTFRVFYDDYTIADELASLRNLIDSKTSFNYRVVTELPEASEDTCNIIFFVKDENSSIMKEYMTILLDNEDYDWEEIGDTEISLEGYATVTMLQNLNTTIGATIGNLETQVETLENADFDLTVNGVSASVNKSGADITASVNITASDIKMSSAQNAQTISEAIAAAGHVDDVQVKLTNSGEATSVVTNKIATIDLSPYAKTTDLILSDTDFNSIFEDDGGRNEDM